MYTSNSCGESSVHYLWYIYTHTLLIICGSLSYRYVHVYIYIQYTCDIITYIYIFAYNYIYPIYKWDIIYIYVYPILYSYWIYIGFIPYLYYNYIYPICLYMSFPYVFGKWHFSPAIAVCAQLPRRSSADLRSTSVTLWFTGH